MKEKRGMKNKKNKNERKKTDEKNAKTNNEMKKKYTNERINEHKKKRDYKIELKFMVFKKSLGFWYLWKIK